MMKLLRRDQRGIGAVEFALVAPVLITFVVGISQMGKLFFANADMHNAVAAGARVAAVWPVPDDATILAAVNDRLVRTGAADRAEAAVTHGTDANGNSYAEISMTYSVPLDFIFFEAPPVTLTDTRRIFTQVTNANSTTYASTTGTSTSGGTTGSTTTTTTGGTTGTTGGTTSTTGGTTSTTGGTTSTSTSATSASSTSASSTSASSTGGTSATSTSTTSSTTSSSGNASSGNASSSSTSSSSSNGNHAHGNCTKKC